MMENYFDINRFWHFLKLELFKSKKGVVITFVITFGMLFLVGFLLDIVVEPNKTSYAHESNYVSSLLIGGFVLTSLAFNDLGSRLKRSSYLMLPVTALERMIAMWLLTSIGWITLYTITFTLYALIANHVGQIIFSYMTFHDFDPMGSFALGSIKYYLITQGIFMIGATHFRGYVFPKTVMVLVVLAVIGGTFSYVIMKDVFLMDHECTGTECEYFPELGHHTIWPVAKFLFWWVLAPLTWLISYLGLKDQEA